MIARIVTWAVEKRWLVLALTAVAAVIGAYSLSRLPIDAVPDITNNQVQINMRRVRPGVRGLSPLSSMARSRRRR